MAISTFKKHVFAVVAGIALAMGVASSAQASEFTVNPSALGGVKESFTAVQMDGSSSERLVTNADGSRTGSGYIKYTAFEDSSFEQIFMIDGYRLYALFSFTEVDAPNSPRNSILTSLSYTLWGDILRDDIFHPSIGSNSNATVGGGTANDIALGSGSLIYGDSSFPASGGVTLGATTTFHITAAGSNFFKGPLPFFTATSNSFSNTAFSGSVVNSDGSVSINSPGSTSFNNPIPEPTSVALFGLGLLGLSAGFRRRKN